MRAGQSSSFALKKIKRGEIRKGMVLVSPISDPKGMFLFVHLLRGWGWDFFGYNLGKDGLPQPQKYKVILLILLWLFTGSE